MMGHTDRLVICDSGLPIPRGSDVVDISLTRNIPRFVDTVRVVLEELVVERGIIAREMLDTDVHADLLKLLKGIPLKVVSHEEFKQFTMSGGNIAFVRTGEATPYANVILIAGVDFD
jgi:D-ribose pyranase